MDGRKHHHSKWIKSIIKATCAVVKCYRYAQCSNQGKINGCPMDNQVTISGCPSRFLVVRTWNVCINIHVQRWLLAKDLWLSVGQLHQYFWLSGIFFGCPGCMDNQNFECWVCALLICDMTKQNEHDCMLYDWFIGSGEIYYRVWSQWNIWCTCNYAQFPTCNMKSE